MTKKKKIILVVLSLFLIVGNIVFLSKDTFGKYKNESTLISFNDNICITRYEDVYHFDFYHVIDNVICLHPSEKSAYCGINSLNGVCCERDSVFKIITEDGKSLISTEAIFMQVFFLFFYLLIIGYVVYYKIHKKQIIKNAVKVTETES